MGHKSSNIVRYNIENSNNNQINNVKSTCKNKIEIKKKPNIYNSTSTNTNSNEVKIKKASHTMTDFRKKINNNF